MNPIHPVPGTIHHRDTGALSHLRVWRQHRDSVGRAAACLREEGGGHGMSDAQSVAARP